MPKFFDKSEKPIHTNGRSLGQRICGICAKLYLTQNTEVPDEGHTTEGLDCRMLETLVLFFMESGKGVNLRVTLLRFFRLFWATVTGVKKERNAGWKKCLKRLAAPKERYEGRLCGNAKRIPRSKVGWYDAGLTKTFGKESMVDDLICSERAGH